MVGRSGQQKENVPITKVSIAVMFLTVSRTRILWKKRSAKQIKALIKMTKNRMRILLRMKPVNLVKTIMKMK